MSGGHSTYLANALGGRVLGASALSRPATVYLEPYETNPNEAGAGGDVPDSGYSARVAVTNNNTNFPAASGGVKTLATAQTLYTASGAETLTGVGIWDASTSGNLLGLFVPSSNLVTASGKRVKIPASTLTLTLTGEWETALENALLDHVFGGGDYTPISTLYFGLISSGTTELSGNGYARVGKTNNTTTFPAWSSGATSNGVEIQFGPGTGSNWSAANRVGIYDASSAGNLLMVSDLDAAVTVLVGELATFDAGELDFTFTSNFA